MPKKAPRIRIDTRDLPESFDPHYFYEYRIQKRASEADGIEGALYKIIPYDIIRSFAFAIDPFAAFKVSPFKITPVQRSRYRYTSSVFDNADSFFSQSISSRRTTVNWMNRPGLFGPFYDTLPTQPADKHYHVGVQSPLKGSQQDTTRRTRPIGSTAGEFKMSKPAIYNTVRNMSYSNHSMLWISQPGGGYPDAVENTYQTNWSWYPRSARFALNDYNDLLISETNILSAAMQKNAISMYTGILPTHRNYSLARNIVELRDIPRSIASLRETLGHLSEIGQSLYKMSAKDRNLINSLKPLSKDIPNEWLSYNFGWRQTYSDIMGLLSTPAKISKQIDLLIARNGKATTYRKTKKLISATGSAPGFRYDSHSSEYSRVTASRIQREIELRMVVNTTFDFPTTNVPKFRRDLFLQKLGVTPTATDLYNLVPWTWLVDWFTGLGNYVDIIDTVNSDKSLINWGFITGVSHVMLQTDYRSKVDSIDDVTYDGKRSRSTNVGRNSHVSNLELQLQLRNNLAGILDVNATSDPSSLTNYQNSILGAILSQRVKFSR